MITKMKTQLFGVWKVSALCFLVLVTLPCLALADTYDGGDNDKDNARLLSVWAEEPHDFPDANDEDWIKFDAEAGKRYRIEVANPEPNCYAEITLYYDINDPALSISDEGGKGNDVWLDWKFEQAGSYSVRIKNNETVNEENTGYNLTLSEIDDYEEDNSFFQAKQIPVKVNEPQHHNFHKSGDEDWMFFKKVSGCDKYDIILTTTAFSYDDVEVELYDADENFLISPSREENGSLIVTCKDCSGDYCYIRIKSSSDANIFDNNTGYDIKVDMAWGWSVGGKIKGLVLEKGTNLQIGEATIFLDNGNDPPAGIDTIILSNDTPFPGLIGLYETQDNFPLGTYTVSAQSQGYIISSCHSCSEKSCTDLCEVTISQSDELAWVDIYMEPENNNYSPPSQNTLRQDRDRDGRGSSSRDKRFPCRKYNSSVAGIVKDSTDCNDSDENEFPGNPEVCGDGIDQDCNGSDLSCSDTTTSTTSTSTSTSSTTTTIPPPICPTWYKDTDNDKYSDGTSQNSCQRPAGYKSASELQAISGDCNDNDKDIFPGNPEVCDGKDNDCDGYIDEEVMLTWYNLKVS
jgi:hypothetical protein